ncbi:uncharacterized protein LOC143295102 [Babylonia areolata]|uniref:uncharacterized protein LOC143295102 n=1 Tax=Babylonia areolata TaxID=304850 RepID=UPI003FD00AFF
MSSESRDGTQVRDRGDDDGGKDGTSSASGSGDKHCVEESLKKQTWFWPNTTRDEAKRSLAGQPDGTFLVRDCSVPGDFTLTVRQAGSTRCVRIYRQRNGYSLSATETDNPFASVQDLVGFYGHRSLSSFNKRLDVCLTRPLPKPASGGGSQYGVFKELYDLSQQQLSAQTRLSVLTQQRSHLCQKVKLFEMMVPALRTVQQMYYESMQLQEKSAPIPPVMAVMADDGSEVSGESEDCDRLKTDVVSTADSGSSEGEGMGHRLSKDEEKSVTVNTRLLLTRHTAMSDKLHSFKSNLDVDSVRLQDLEAEMQSVERKLLLMRERQEELVRQMVAMGCQREYLDRVLEPRVATREFDRSTWQRDCSREDAVSLLEGLPHGAFLLRRKEQRHLPFVLSIVISGESEPRMVQHCYVVRPSGRGYGFNAALAVFESVDQLVLRHRHVNLKHYFKDLDVTLTFPVGCQELLLRSMSESEKESATVKEGEYANAAAIQDAMVDSVYESVDFPERSEEEEQVSAVSAEGPEKDVCRPEVLVYGNVPFNDAAAVNKESAEMSKYLTMGMPGQGVASKPTASSSAGKEENDEYETMEVLPKQVVSEPESGLPVEKDLKNKNETQEMLQKHAVAKPTAGASKVKELKNKNETQEMLQKHAVAKPTAGASKVKELKNKNETQEMLQKHAVAKPTAGASKVKELKNKYETLEMQKHAVSKPAASPVVVKELKNKYKKKEVLPKQVTFKPTASPTLEKEHNYESIDESDHSTDADCSKRTDKQETVKEAREEGVTGPRYEPVRFSGTSSGAAVKSSDGCKSMTGRKCETSLTESSQEPVTVTSVESGSQEQKENAYETIGRRRETSV